MKKVHDQCGGKFWIYFAEKVLEVGKRIFLFCGIGSRHWQRLFHHFKYVLMATSFNCPMPETSWISLHRNYLHFQKLHLICF